MLLEKLDKVITEIKEYVGKITGLVPEDKKEVLGQLIKEAAIAYGRAKIAEAMKDE